MSSSPLEIVRTAILAFGWPVLLAGGALFIIQAWRFYLGVGKSVLGKLIVGQTAGTLLSMLALGITATFFMFDNVQKGVLVVLPIFGIWFISMVLIYFVARRGVGIQKLSR